MKVKDLIWKLFKIYLKEGNIGLAKWKQFEGFVHIYNFVHTGNVIEISYEPYASTYAFNVFDMHILDAIKLLIKHWILFGNQTLCMYWNEREDITGKTHPRQGLLEVEKIQVRVYSGTKFVEII